MLLAFSNLAYSAEVTLGWDYDHSVEGNETAKFRIYGKKVSITEYTTPMWDSKDETNPQIHQAKVTIEDGEDYNFIARAYNEGVDVDTDEIIILESENSNEVTFNAPEFIMSGLSLTSFPNSEKYEKPVYFGTAGVDITISWGELSGSTYEYRLYDINKKSYVLVGSTSVPNATFKIPKTGCYEFEVRAQRNSNYTEWTKLESRIIGWIAGVGPIVIGN